MADHTPQHGRRPHFNRSRRGPDRRGPDRRLPPRDHQPEGGREPARDGGVDVEQIMREIKSRIAQRHGIELSTQQIQELAARRLEAILEPRNLKPQLLEQLRRSAAATDVPSTPPIQTYEFEESTLFETHRGVVRFFRKLLHPILKLFFNPTPLIQALNTQARINKELAAREVEREQRQSEWNALHYELLQRMVLETARVSIEMHALNASVESLSTKVDFNDRRVRSLEATPSTQPARPHPRHHDTPAPQPPVSTVTPDGGAADVSSSPEGGEGTRRRRRRRRGRRSGGANELAGTPGASTMGDEDVDTPDGPEGDDEESAPSEGVSAEPPRAVRPLPQPPEAHIDPAPQPEANTAVEPLPRPLPTAPTPPRDEPVPDNPTDRNDPGPIDR